MIRIKMIDIDILFSAKSGAVEYETRKSPIGLSGVLMNLQRRFDLLVLSLPTTNMSAPVFYSDIISLRDGVPATPFTGY